MISIENKVLYIVSSHDCGTFVILDSLRNNPDVRVVDNIDDVKRTSKKYILLISDVPVTHILKKIDNVLPIFLFRDVRVGWLITDYKLINSSNNKTIEQYVRNFNALFNLYLKIVNEQDALIFKFEDFLMNKRVAYHRLCKFLDIDYNQIYISHVIKEKSPLLSSNDTEKIIKHQMIVSEDQLSYISSKTKEYNKTSYKFFHRHLFSYCIRSFQD